MKLYMKQKVFTFVDKFSIYDELGNEAYWVEGELFSIGKKLDLFDSYNNHKAHIHQKVLSFLPRYFIQVNGEDVAEVVKHFTLFHQKFSVAGYDWQVDGDFEAVKDKCSFITPVPGGVGPMTITMLLKNTLTASKEHFNK